MQCIASSKLQEVNVKALETKLSVFPVILVKVSCIAWLAF
jgi:hypothetical protein